jgi:hypothetical protein
MNVLGKRRGEFPQLICMPRWLFAGLLATALAIGCDHPFEPFQKGEEAIFSIFGYLDLRADTQWVRVMPVRQSLLLAPEPIDAVVTLEHLRTGRIVTLRDSLFRFVDPQLGGVAYAFNFWTTEPLEVGESYRLTAMRSDGASTTARVDLPTDLELSLFNVVRSGPDSAVLQVRAERVLFVDVLYAMISMGGDPAGSIAVREPGRFPGDPGTVRAFIDGRMLAREGLVDVRRQEIRVGAARADWPYHAGLSDVAVALPGSMPSNVENGLGFVGGVVTWTIPFHRCAVLADRPEPAQACMVTYNGESASIAGRVLRDGCGDPHVMADIRLMETFPDGGAVARTWRTGWDGTYRFEGIEPGAGLVLDLGQGAPAVPLPPLAAGQRYSVRDISVPIGC